MINKAQDGKKLDLVIADEAEALVQAWLDPGFKPKMNSYIQSLAKPKNAKL